MTTKTGAQKPSYEKRYRVQRTHRIPGHADAREVGTSQELARKECVRLNREATMGRTAPSEHHPHGQELSTGGPILHQGEPVAYEVVTYEVEV